MYYPSTALHKAAGGSGILYLNTRSVVSVPYAKADGEFDVLIGDWYSRSYVELRNLWTVDVPLEDQPVHLLMGKQGNPRTSSSQCSPLRLAKHTN